MNTYQELRAMFNNQMVVGYAELSQLFGYDNVTSFRALVNNSQGRMFRRLREVRFQVGKKRMFRVREVAEIWDGL